MTSDVKLSTTVGFTKYYVTVPLDRNEHARLSSSSSSSSHHPTRDQPTPSHYRPWSYGRGHVRKWCHRLRCTDPHSSPGTTTDTNTSTTTTTNVSTIVRVRKHTRGIRPYQRVSPPPRRQEVRIKLRALSQPRSRPTTTPVRTDRDTGDSEVNVTVNHPPSPPT